MADEFENKVTPLRRLRGDEQLEIGRKRILSVLSRIDSDSGSAILNPLIVENHKKMYRNPNYEISDLERMLLQVPPDWKTNRPENWFALAAVLRERYADRVRGQIP